MPTWKAVGDLPKAPGSMWGCEASQHPLLHATQLDRKCRFLGGTLSQPRFISYSPWKTELATSCRLTGERAGGHSYNLPQTLFWSRINK